MKISDASKVGLLAIVAIGILIWGYTFLKGKNLFDRSTVIYVEYDNVEGLTASTPVRVNGFKVGIVGDVYLKEDYSGKIMVALDLTEDLNIAKNQVVAVIETTSFMGGKQINLIFPPGHCGENDCLQNGDTIRGEMRSMIVSMVPEANTLLPKLEEILVTLDKTVKEFGNSLNGGNVDSKINQSLNDVTQTLTNLNATSKNLRNLTGSMEQKVDGILTDMNDITTSLKGSNSDIQKTLTNTATFTDNLRTVDLNKTLGGADDAVGELKQTLNTLDNTVAELQTTLKKVNSGEGTLGKLITEDKMYYTIDSAAFHLGLLLQDFRLNPRRYTAILKKNRGDYQKVKPKDDPALKKDKK